MHNVSCLSVVVHCKNIVSIGSQFTIKVIDFIIKTMHLMKIIHIASLSKRPQTTGEAVRYVCVVVFEYSPEPIRQRTPIVLFRRNSHK